MRSVLENKPSSSSAKGRKRKSKQPTSDANSRRVRQFLEEAERRGYATLDEIGQVLPEAEEDIGLLDDIFNYFETHGILVYDMGEEAEKAHLEPELLEGEGKPEDVSLADIAVDDTVSLYLREMAREPLLSREEEIELAKCIERGHAAMERLTAEELSPEERAKLEADIQAAEEARARFIRANTRLVVSIAKKYVNRGVPLLDLIQEGNLGLIRAVEKFDYRQGHRFSTYATWWIRQAIRRALADQGRTIRIPIHISDRIHKVQRAIQQLEKQLGRRPTLEEIAEMVDIPPYEVRWILNSSRQLVSLEQPVGEEQENELGYFIEDEQLITPSDATAQTLLAEEMDRVLATLDPREEKILRLRYGLQDGRNYSLEEVGERFGLTRERIRQIEGQALRKLRHPRRSRSLRDFLS